MKRVGLLAVILLWTVGGVAQSEYILRSGYDAFTLGTPGETAVAGSRTGQGWAFSLTRAVLDRVDVTAHISGDSLFGLGVRAVLVRDLLPLRVAVEVQPEAFSIMGTVLLGPVRAEFGRVWAVSPQRWALLRYGVSEALSVTVGVVVVGERVGPHMEWTVYPDLSRSLGVSIALGVAGFRLSIGGLL